MPEVEGWTRYRFKDAFKIAVIAKIAQLLNARVENAAIAAQHVHGFTNDTAFLVLTSGPIKAGGMRLKDGSTPEVNIPGALHPKVVRGRELARTLEAAGPRAALVLNLDALEDVVKVGWPK